MLLDLVPWIPDEDVVVGSGTGAMEAVCCISLSPVDAIGKGNTGLRTLGALRSDLHTG